MPETETGFDYAQFKKLLLHFDDANPVERGKYIKMALDKCAAGNLHFWEAVEDAYGGSNSELEQLRDELRDTRNEAEKIAKDGAEQISEQAEKIARLQSENAELTERLNNAETAKPVPVVEEKKRWSSSAWLQPKRLLLMLGAAVFLNWLGAYILGSLPPSIPYSGFPDFVNLCTQIARGFSNGLFVLWALAIYHLYGRKALIARLFLWAAGWFVILWWIVSSFTKYSDTAQAGQDWFWLKIYMLPHVWWSPWPYEQRGHVGQDFTVAMVVLAVIVALNYFNTGGVLLRGIRKVVNE